MKILITGASGFIGTALIERLLARGDEIYAWVHEKQPKQTGVKTVKRLADCPPVDAVINLAGAPIADARWTEARKALLQSSRMKTTEALVDWIASSEAKPEVLISGSAIGYYGAVTKETIIDEDAEPIVSDFSSLLCRAWEAAAIEAEKSGVRVALVRTGIVLGAGGALAKMKLPFSMGMGGPIASGQQWMSWIHLDDEVSAIIHLLDNKTLSGPFNLCAPGAVRNKAFVKELGRALHRPAFMPMPALGVNLMLGSEASSLLTEGLSVAPQRLLKSGFEFQYPKLPEAMKSAIAAF